MNQPRSDRPDPSHPRPHGEPGTRGNEAKPTKPLFQHVAILGVGLLGASLGMALREGGIAGRVTGIGRAGSESLDIALRRGAVDDISTDAAMGVRGADLVVLATNISAFGPLMDVLAAACGPECLITDVGSTKAEVMALAKARMPDCLFVGSHPMAGSEKSGPAHARADLYRGGLCLVVPRDDAAAGKNVAAVTDRIIQLWRAVGMRTQILDAQEHDRWVAVISHVPHVLAAMMVNLTEKIPEARAAAAGGFFDTTRVASGNVDMWTDILMSNRRTVRDQLDQLGDQLQEVVKMLRSADQPAVRAWLKRAKDIRDQMVKARAGGR